MALDLNISDAAAIAAVDALLAEIDAGGTTNNGKLYIYDNTQARGFTHAAGAVLAEFDLRDPASGGAFAGAALDAGDIKAALASVPLSDTSANKTGTADWFAFTDHVNTIVFYGECGISGADLNLDNLSITAGQQVNITSFSYKKPRFSGD